MRRRAGATALILVLLGGCPLRASGAVVAPTARVEVRSASAGALRRLCALVSRCGADVRLLVGGGKTWLEVSSARRGDLAAALGALERAAGSAGVKVRLCADGIASEVQAVSCRPAAADEPQRKSVPAPPAAVWVAPGAPCAPSRFSADAAQAPRAEANPRSAARGVRGPPP